MRVGQGLDIAEHEVGEDEAGPIRALGHRRADGRGRPRRRPHALRRSARGGGAGRRPHRPPAQPPPVGHAAGGRAPPRARPWRAGAGSAARCSVVSTDIPTMIANSSPSIVPVALPIPATMIPTSPRGTIPTPTNVASRRPMRSAPTYAPANFVTTASSVTPASSSTVSRSPNAASDSSQADEGEEERRKEGVERRHLLLDRMLVARLGDDHAGQERTDDRGQADLRGERREAEADDHGRQQRRLREARRVQQRRPPGQQLRPAERDEADERDGDRRPSPRSSRCRRRPRPRRPPRPRRAAAPGCRRRSRRRGSCGWRGARARPARSAPRT